MNPEAKASDDETYLKLYNEAVQLTEKFDIEVKHPHSAARHRHRANAPAASTFDYFKRYLHSPFLEHLIVQLEDRMCNAVDRVRRAR